MIGISPNPWSPGLWFVGHGVEICFDADSWTKAAGYSALDLSGDERFTFRIRGYVNDDDSAKVFDVQLTESAEAASGVIRHYLALGTTVYPSMTWYVVLVDNDNADGDTATGKRETPLLRFREPIQDIPLGAAS